MPIAIHKKSVVPADADTAAAFAASALEGEYFIFEKKSESGDSNEATTNEFTITGKNENGGKVTFSFYAKSNINENDINTALINKTFNGVRFSEIYVIGAKVAKG